MIYSENDLSYWFPYLDRADISTPDTYWANISNGLSLAELLDGDMPWVLDPLTNMLETMGSQVRFPLFLRTGYGSGKHNFNQCCRVKEPGDIPSHVGKLVEWSHLVSLPHLPHDTWVVREMLDADPLFYCEQYGSMPVVREWRYFIHDEKALYGIPYWPEDALEEGNPDDEGWREKVEVLHSEPEGGRELAQAVSEAIPSQLDPWSVDVLDAADGLYVIDMALAQSSWGWDLSRAEDEEDSNE